MELDVISFHDLLGTNHTAARKKLITAFFEKGVAGIRDVPGFLGKSRDYVEAARRFALLDAEIKQRYAPDRDAGEIEGYELGAEWFKDQAGQWRIDDKKASYYAFVPDSSRNKWPREVDLRTAYLELGELIFNSGKQVFNLIGLNAAVGINHDELLAFGRMLHYHKEGETINVNPHWCGGHFDHGVFTGLMPAYYFRDGKEVEEPKEAGLFVVPTNGENFEKINATDKSVLLFQVGEFGQLASDDRICATKHKVVKTLGNIERFTFALFYNPADKARIYSRSVLTKDARYTENQEKDGSVLYSKWAGATYDRYRAVIHES